MGGLSPGQRCQPIPGFRLSGTPRMRPGRLVPQPRPSGHSFPCEEPDRLETADQHGMSETWPWFGIFQFFHVQTWFWLRYLRYERDNVLSDWLTKNRSRQSLYTSREDPSDHPALSLLSNQRASLKSHIAECLVFTPHWSSVRIQTSYIPLLNM